MPKDKKTSENEKNIDSIYGLNCLMGLRDDKILTEMSNKISGWISKFNGEIIEAEKENKDENNQVKSAFWVEKRRLAYPIKKDNFGYYVSLWLKLSPEQISGFKRLLKLENDIIRFQVIREKEGIAIIPSFNAVPITEIKKLELITEKQFYPGREATSEQKGERRFQKKEEKIFGGQLPQEEKIEKTAIEKTIIEKSATGEEISKSQEEEAKTQDIVIETMIKGEKTKKEADLREEKVESDLAKEKKKPEIFPKSKEKGKKSSKISLEDLDKRLDDILNEEII